MNSFDLEPFNDTLYVKTYDPINFMFGEEPTDSDNYFNTMFMLLICVALLFYMLWNIATTFVSHNEDKTRP